MYHVYVLCNQVGCDEWHGGLAYIYIYIYTLYSLPIHHPAQYYFDLSILYREL